MNHNMAQNMSWSILPRLLITELIYWKDQRSTPTVLMIACVLYFGADGNKFNLVMKVCLYHSSWLLK